MSNASERNKLFRSHCNIEVSLDKENNSVSVQVSYKPELLENPLSGVRHEYGKGDVVEELVRQGIGVDPNTCPGFHIDNTTISNKRQQYLEAKYTFASAKKETPVVATTTDPPREEVKSSASIPKKSTKRRQRAKATNQ